MNSIVQSCDIDTSIDRLLFNHINIFLDISCVLFCVNWADKIYGRGNTWSRREMKLILYEKVVDIVL